MESNFLKIGETGQIAIGHDLIPGDTYHKAIVRGSSPNIGVISYDITGTLTTVNTNIGNQYAGIYTENQAIQLEHMNSFTYQLSSSYTELEYVNSSGRYVNVRPSGTASHTTQYYELPFIDTGLTPVSGSKYSFYVQMRSNTSSSNSIGCAYSSNYGWCVCGREYDTNLRSIYANSSISDTNALFITPVDSNWHEYFMKFGRQSVDGTNKSYSFSGNFPRSGSASLNFYIGAMAYNWGPSSPTNYFENVNNDFGLIVAWDPSNFNEVTRFYVPCKRNSDNAVGFYEFVNGEFKPSDKSAYPFTTGPTLATKNKYILADLIV